MIAVLRTAEPLVLVANRAAWLNQLTAAFQAKDSVLFKKFQKKYGHQKVKETLEAMFSEKCAYCESHINVVTTGHIEHFRPKARFRGLTFEWTNLLLSCPKCNDKAHKSNKFPSVSAGGRLIDPTSEDPNLHFEFIYDPATRRTVIKSKTLRGQTTADIFKLNSRKALVQSRSTYIRHLIALKTYEKTDQEAANLIAEAKLELAPYKAWARAFL